LTSKARIQTKQCLLVFGLSRHRPHFRLLHRRPDCPCVRRIGLVRLHKGANKLRMQEHDLVPKRFDLARPPMPTAARLQRYPAGRPPRQKRKQLVTSKASIHDLTGLCVNPVQLEHALCNIQSICRSIHFGPSVP
jgi:hypothetical protein